MRPTSRRHAATVAGVVGAGIITAGLFLVPVARAEPIVEQTDPTSAEPNSMPLPALPAAEDSTASACARFAEALDLASLNYSDFADATSGDQWRYDDSAVRAANVTGRTALRAAASAALQASGTAGLPADVATPMRLWSLHATKLLLKMGLRSGDDSINSAAIDLNDDTTAVQEACTARHATA